MIYESIPTPGAAPAILTVTADWPGFGNVRELYWDVLYRDFGVAAEADWFHAEAGGEFSVAVDADGTALGASRLLPSPGDSKRQLRQVAVRESVRGTGLGTRLVLASEDRALSEGADEVWLYARDTALSFYERLGYVAEGEWFESELTGIPHVTMRKHISEAR